ncbi:MAG: hypothetical protein MK132_25310 [Lentisphaerales bacterium]|nr:hypothetical protein [Lentisphaerales bacterium]
MKFGFITCVQLGLSCIEKIYEIGGKLDLAITLYDDLAVKKSGRIYLDSFCTENNLKLKKIRHINDKDCLEAVENANLDWLFIIGWSQIASKELLAIPARGCLGIHPTLLPQGRGRAAIPWAILKGLEKTGVTLFKLNEGVDTGDIVSQFQILLNENSDSSWLYKEVNKAHELLIAGTWNSLLNDSIQLKRQEESSASLWPGRTPKDGKINLSGTVLAAERLIRASTRPYPGAYYITQKGMKKIIWKAKVSDRYQDGMLKFKDGYLKILEFDLEKVD